MLLIYFLCVFLLLNNILPSDAKMVMTRVVVVVFKITFVAVSAGGRFTFLKEEEEEEDQY